MTIDVRSSARSLIQKLDRRLQSPPSQPKTRIAVQKDALITSNTWRILNFQGAGVLVTDDPANRRTNILINGGAIISAATYVVSTPGVGKALTLWNGSVNVSPPASWETVGFNDAAWATTVLPNGATSPVAYNFSPTFGTARPIHASLAALSGNPVDQTLTRTSFTLPAGTITGATLRIMADSALNSVYVNGTLSGSHADVAWPGPTPTSFLDVSLNPSLLVPGASTNLIATMGTNTLAPSVQSGVIWRLTVNYGLASPPVVAGWTQVNMTGGSATDVPGGIQLLGNASTGNDVKLLLKATPATPYTVTAGFLPQLYPADFSSAGLALRDSASGKLVLFQLRMSAGVLQQAVLDYTNATTFSATETTASGAMFGGASTVWMQIQDDGTNISFLSSVDGANWNSILKRSRTTFLTADQVGIMVNSAASNQPVSMTLTSWSGA